MNNIELIKRINMLEGRIDRLADNMPEIGVRRSTLDVSNPPTDAELDAEFGSPANFYDVIIINDNNAGANYWLVVSDGTSWLYEEMTAAA